MRRIHDVRLIVLVFLVGIGSSLSPNSAASQGPPAVVVTDVALSNGDPGVQLQLTNGHRLLWDKVSCRLYEWRDQRGVVLAHYLAPSVTSEPIVVAPTDTPNDPLLGDWWREGPGRHNYVSATPQGASVTVNCDEHTAAGVSIPVAYTWTGVSREIGGLTYRGLSVRVAVDASRVAGLTGLAFVGYGLDSLAPAGQASGFAEFHFNGNGGLLRQWNFDATVPGDNRFAAKTQTFTLLRHPQGTFVAYLPNIPESWQNFTGMEVALQTQEGVALSTQFEPPRGDLVQWTTPTALWLFSDEAAARPTAQVWLDVRFATLKEQLAGLGLPYRRMQAPFDGFTVGGQYWTDAIQPAAVQSYAQNSGHVRDANRIMAHTAMFRATQPGPASTISYVEQLGQDLYLPNAVDLPPTIPGVTFPGQPPLQDPKTPGDYRYPGHYTYGTMQDLRDWLATLRLLGTLPGLWIREYYPGCFGYDPNNTTQWSRWDKSWTCSYLWKAHPDWGQQLADGSLDPAPQAFPNGAHPAYIAWREAWQQYWLDQGVQGFFLDTGGFPEQTYSLYNGVPISDAVAQWALFTRLARQGAYITGEGPLAFNYALSTVGPPPGQEWAFSFTAAGVGHPAVDPAARLSLEQLRRYHSVYGASQPDGDIVRLAQQAPDGPAFDAELVHYGALRDQFGAPDRVELQNVRRRTAPAVTLQRAMGTSATDQVVLGCQQVYSFPSAGRYRIGSEVVFARETIEVETNGLGCGVGRLVRGVDGTAVSAHAVGTPVVSLDNDTLFDWDDTYWVYGSGSSEVWVRYSDGTVWAKGGQQAAASPQIRNVQVQTSGTTATVSWTTDVPTQGWVSYDTYGNAERYASLRQPQWWPIYRAQSDVDTVDLPFTTAHTVTLPNLQAGATYHYRLSARAPAPASTADATFVAGGGAGPTATPLPLATATVGAASTATPTRTPTPGAATATPGAATATPVAASPTPGGSLQTVDDAVQGSGVGQFAYVGSWTHNASTASAYNGTASWSNVLGDTVTLSFDGTQVTYYALKAPDHGLAAVALDGGAETLVDLYAATVQGNVAVYTSPVLPAGRHTFRVRATGQKQASAADTYATLDRVVIATGGATPVPSPTPTPTQTPLPSPTTASNSPTATPTPTQTLPAATATPVAASPTPGGSLQTVDDAVQGSGVGQFAYVGSWTHNASTASAYNGTASWSNVLGDTVTLSFDGTQVTYYALKAPDHGLAAVALDGGAETLVDLYAATVQGNVAVYTSPVLPAGRHTFRVRATGQKQASAADTYATLDRVVITSAPAATPSSSSTPTRTPTPVPATATPVAASPTPGGSLQTVDDAVQGSGVGQFAYVGSWTHNASTASAYNGTASWSNVLGDTVTLSFDGTQVTYYALKAPDHGLAAVALDGGAETLVDLYAATVQGNVAVYTSPVLPAGRHTFRVRATGQKQASAVDTYATLDRVVIR